MARKGKHNIAAAGGQNNGKRQKRDGYSSDRSDADNDGSNDNVVSDGSSRTPSPNKKYQAFDQEKLTQLLGMMLEYKMNENGPVKLETLGKEHGFHHRSKNHLSAWKYMRAEHLIVEAGKNEWVISEKGVDLVKTPEYEEYLRDKSFQPKSPEEHLEHIKKKIMGMKKTSGNCSSEQALRKTGIRIFDQLLEYGPLTRQELAGLIGVKPGSHSFSYALSELLRLEYVEQDPLDRKKVRLSDRAFMRPEERPEPNALDPKKLEEAFKYATTRNKDDPKLCKTKKTFSPGNDQSFKNFAKSHRPIIKKENPGLKSGAITSMLHDMWLALSDDKKNEVWETGSSNDCEDPNEKEEEQGADTEEDNGESGKPCFNAEDEGVAEDSSSDLATPNPLKTEKMDDFDPGELPSLKLESDTTVDSTSTDSAPLDPNSPQGLNLKSEQEAEKQPKEVADSKSDGLDKDFDFYS